MLAVVADEGGLNPVLVEKDDWIMRCLWGLQAQGRRSPFLSGTESGTGSFQFELKGGASLSKGAVSSIASPKTLTPH